MRSLTLAIFASAGLLYGQTAPPPAAAPPQPPPAQVPSAPIALLTMPPATVVATIDGEKVTAGELQVILRGRPAAQQETILKNPRAFLEQFGLMRKLSAMAEKAGIDKTSPLKEQLVYNRMLAMAQAELQASEAQISVSSDEIQKYYDGHKDQYSAVRVKAIYIPFSPTSAAPPAGSEKKLLSEPEAKQKIDKVYADLKAGADFVKMVKENSGDAGSVAKDGDFGTFRRSDNIPEEVKKAIFALKAGEISSPVRHTNGFYVFRAEAITSEPLDTVRNLIMEQLRSTRMNEWIQATQKSIQIEIPNEAAFAPAPAQAK